MTIGNKWLMMQSSLKQHTQVVVVVQNLIAVAITAVGAMLGLLQVRPISRRQLLFYSWDAVVLAVQLWTSFKALQHLSVSATTVCRSLAIPVVAWLEWLILSTRLTSHRQISGWLVVIGAFIYFHEDVVYASAPLEGYLWALANLISYCSNSVLDKIFMSSLDQTPSGMAMLTQLISLPISLAGIALFEQGDAADIPLQKTFLVLNKTLALALLITGALAAALGRAYAACYKVSSATAVTVAGNVNKMLAILSSVFLFDARMTSTQLAGMGLCLAAATSFSLQGLKACGGQRRT